MSLWQKGCLVLLLVGLLTACRTALVTDRRTPTPAGTGTTTIVAEALTPTGESTVAATAAVPPTVQAEATIPIEPTVVVEATGTHEATSLPTGGTDNATTLPPAVTVVPEAPVQTAVVIVPATRVPVSNNERWRQQQVDRQPLPEPQFYTTTGSELFWYDPVYQQSVLLGTFRGPFEVLATFRLRSTGQPALEVLYEVNKRYGLTALSPAIVERITAAGYTNGVIDTYVIIDDNVEPR